MSTIAEKLTTIAENEQKVYDKGMSDGEYDMWKCFTFNGTRTDHAHAFSYMDVSGKQAPKELFQASENWEEMFLGYMGRTLPSGIDFSVWDSSCATTYEYFFYYSQYLEEIYDLKIPQIDAYEMTFLSCPELKRIEKIRVSVNTQFYSTFDFCEALSDVTFEGVIGKDLSFKYSPLSIASMKNIISSLNNYAGTSHEAKYTLTFTTACWTALEASGKPYDDGLTTDETLTWENYVISLGWNV